MKKRQKKQGEKEERCQKIHGLAYHVALSTRRHAIGLSSLIQASG